MKNSVAVWVRVIREGEETILKLHPCTLQRLMDAANRHFGSPEKWLGGPRRTKEKKHTQ